VTSIEKAAGRNQMAAISRRGLLSLTGTAIAGAYGVSAVRAADDLKVRPILCPNEKIDIGGRGKEIIQRAYDLGHEYEKKNGGCAQCTLAAVQDAVDFIEFDEGLFRAACSLDGGATPTGIQSCGGFTGSGMFISYLCGRTRDGKRFHGSSGPAHRVHRRVYEHYIEEYGTVLCKDVRKGAGSDCPLVCGRAAQWAAEAILIELTNYVADEAEEGDQPQTEP